MQTKVLAVDASRIGQATATAKSSDVLDELDFKLDLSAVDGKNLKYAAEQIRDSDVPVAFPTETVYGLGADATRSEAVKGIYKAKQRPSDNPLIVHFSSLEQLRSLLRPSASGPRETNGFSSNQDPIPSIYHPLIARFWPGPLTIILANPPHAPLAPEVTAGLSTFGARIPRHLLALALIATAGVPIAAPSANASTKPSPTAAEHVLYDLDGRIETIVDGGLCDVGVESTVVDGLSEPPLVLRPGGISLEQIRGCEGWSHTQIGYKNTSEIGAKPKAPGMKYRHYSPKATVILCESGQIPTSEQIHQRLGAARKVGIVRTGRWSIDAETSGAAQIRIGTSYEHQMRAAQKSFTPNQSGFSGMLQTLNSMQNLRNPTAKHEVLQREGTFELLDINLGSNTSDIARGIFSALRELDRHEVDAIFVEGIVDDEGDLAAAIMNRLRKAAEVQI